MNETGQKQKTFTVVGVRFKKAGKIYYFDPSELELKPGMDVIVETVRGWSTAR